MRALPFLAIVAFAAGCDTGPALVDSGPVDSGPPRRLCPTEGVPAPDELMGPCCWRADQSTQTDAPELRLNYLEITEPTGSPLASMTLRRVLNESMQDETFNWLVRVDGASADGTVSVVTGFGRRNADGTYNFSNGMGEDPDTWCPATIPATLSGETFMSSELDGALTVPIFDNTGTTLQVELVLRALTIREATWTESRSCIGAKTNRPFTYTTGATLAAYIEVEPSRTQVINVPPSVDTTVCAAVAGALADATYCETVAQADWMIPPDSLCGATGCQQNAVGMTDVCDPASSDPGGCNAWHLVAGFAAGGVDIANGACP